MGLTPYDPRQTVAVIGVHKYDALDASMLDVVEIVRNHTHLCIAWGNWRPLCVCNMLEDAQPSS